MHHSSPPSAVKFSSQEYHSSCSYSLSKAHQPECLPNFFGRLKSKVYRPLGRSSSPRSSRSNYSTPEQNVRDQMSNARELRCYASRLGVFSKLRPRRCRVEIAGPSDYLTLAQLEMFWQQQDYRTDYMQQYHRSEHIDAPWGPGHWRIP